jgi:hypothetical protein
MPQRVLAFLLIIGLLTAAPLPAIAQDKDDEPKRAGEPRKTEEPLKKEENRPPQRLPSGIPAASGRAKFCRQSR